MSEKINSFIKDQLEKEKSKKEIKDALLSSGWEESDIEKAFFETLSEMNKKVMNNNLELSDDKNELEESKNAERSKLFLLALIIFILLILLGMMIYAFLSLDPRGLALI